MDDLTEVARVLADYDIGQELGRGQFGVVWEARHRHLGRRVAVKQLIHLSEHDREESARRFRREGRILAGLDHPHVVSVYDYREAGELRLIVMEHLDGGSLADRSDALGGPGQMAAVVASATALHSVHRSGVLHRDVKPENMLFDSRGVLKVTDFGVARGDGTLLGTTTSVELSHVGQFLGTPAYASPEQAEAALTGADIVIGPAADQYGLAAVYFELLTGELTHDAEGGFLGLSNRRMSSPAPHVRDLAPDVHPSIDAVVARALARAPEDRYPDVEAFAVALVQAGNATWGQGWLDRSSVVVRDTGPPWQAAQAGTPPPPARTPVVPVVPGGADPQETVSSSPPSPPGSGAAMASPPLPAPSDHDASSASGAPTVAAPDHRRGHRLTLALSVAAVAIVLVVSGIAITVLVGDGDQPSAGSPTTTTPGLGQPAPGTVAMTQAWSQPTGGRIISSPAVADDRVVIGSDDGTVYALDAESGDVLWEEPTGGEVQSSAAVAPDGTSIVGNSVGEVIALDREGERRWTFDVRGDQPASPTTPPSSTPTDDAPDPFQVFAAPVVVGDTVVVAADKVYGIGLADGRVRWRYETEYNLIASPVVTGSTVVVADTNGTVAVLDVAADGRELWTADEPANNLFSTPAVDGDGLVVGDGSGVLWFLALADGDVEAQLPLGSPIRSSPVVSDGVVYVGTEAGTVVAVADREVLWEEALPQRVRSSPVVVDGLVVVGCDDGHVYALDATSGARVSSFRTGGQVLSSPRALGEGVVVGSADGDVYALSDLRG